MKLSKVAIGLCFSFVCGAVFSENDVYNKPSDLFKSALQHESSIRAALAKESSAQAQIGIARSSLLPQLDLNLYGGKEREDIYNLVNDKTRGLPANYDRKRYGVRLTQAIFNVESIYGVNQADAVYQSRQSETLKASNDLGNNVITSYLQVLLARENIELAKSQLKAYQEQVNSAQQQLKAGVGTITDVYSAESRRDLAQVDLLDSQDKIVQFEQQLQVLTGVKSLRFAAVSNFDPKRFDLLKSKDDVFKDVLQSNPAVLSGQKMVTASTYDLSRTRASNLPTISLVATADQENKDYQQYKHTEAYYRIGIEVNFALLTGGRHYYNNDDKSAQLRLANAQLDQVRDQLLNDFQRDFQLYELNKQKIPALLIAKESTEKSVYAARKSHEHGVKTINDIFDAERIYYQTRRDLLQSYVQYIAAWLRIRLSTGALTETDLSKLDGLVNG